MSHGIQPAQLPSTAITLGASPYTWQNVNPFPVAVFVSGGTVSAIAISGDGATWNATGETAGQFVVGARQQIRVTYSSAPTVRMLPI